MDSTEDHDTKSNIESDNNDNENSQSPSQADDSKSAPIGKQLLV